MSSRTAALVKTCVYQDVKYMVIGTATSSSVVIAGNVATFAGPTAHRPLDAAPDPRLRRAEQRERLPHRQEQRDDEDEEYRLRGAGVKQHALVGAGPGHRRDQQEAKAEHDEREGAAAPPPAAAPADLARGRQVPAAERQDQHQHRQVEAPLRERRGNGQLGRSAVSGRERGHTAKLPPVVAARDAPVPAVHDREVWR